MIRKEHTDTDDDKYNINEHYDKIIGFTDAISVFDQKGNALKLELRESDKVRFFEVRNPLNNQ